MARKTPVILGDDFNCAGSKTDSPSICFSWSFNAKRR